MTVTSTSTTLPRSYAFETQAGAFIDRTLSDYKGQRLSRTSNLVLFVVGFRPDITVYQRGVAAPKSGAVWQVSKAATGQTIRIAIPTALVGKYFTRGYMPYPASVAFAYNAAAFSFSWAQTDTSTFKWYSFPINVSKARVGQTYSFSLNAGTMNTITTGSIEIPTNNVKVDFQIKIVT
jgi:hypothetical protein